MIYLCYLLIKYSNTVIHKISKLPYFKEDTVVWKVFAPLVSSYSCCISHNYMFQITETILLLDKDNPNKCKMQILNNYFIY